MYTVHASLVPQETLRWSIQSHGTENSSGNKTRSELLWNWGRATAVMMKSEVGQGQLQAFQLLVVGGMEGDYTSAFRYHWRHGSAKKGRKHKTSRTYWPQLGGLLAWRLYSWEFWVRVQNGWYRISSDCPRISGNLLYSTVSIQNGHITRWADGIWTYGTY